MAWIVRATLAIAVAQVAVWWQPAGATPSTLVAIAAVALAMAVLAVLSQDWPSAAMTAGPLLRRAVALRRKSWSAAFQRQRNPDAAGRPRPRAPSAAPAAA